MENQPKQYPDQGVDLPGPITWDSASHFLEYDEVNFTVETWCRMGPEDRKFTLRTRVRPMCESEIIHVKLKGHSREAVLHAFGYDPVTNISNSPEMQPWYKWLFSKNRTR